MRLLQSWQRTGQLATALLLSTLLPSAALGQVTVSVANVSAAVGQEVSIPVLVSGVESGQGVSAFQMTVTSDDADLVFVGHETAGTLVAGFTVNSNPSNGRVGGFTSSASAFNTSGTLIFLKMKANADVATTVTLVDFRLNAGNPAHTPSVPSFNFSTGGVVNNAPVASNVSATTQVNTPTEITLVATDANGDPLTYSVVAAPSNGTLGSISGNKVTYTPNAGFTGSDSFTYRANDGDKNSNTATVSITVNGSGGGNTAPSATGDSYTTAEDTPLTVTAPGVLANDSDADSDPLTASLQTSPDHGSVSLAADGSFVYVPAANYFGTDSFTYRANDGSANSPAAVVSLTITAVNDAPVAQNGSVVADAGTSTQITLVATDVEQDPLTYTLLSAPANGTLSTVSGNKVTYTPNVGYTGADAFNFRASDGSANSNTATVSISVQGNTAPVANDDSYGIDEDLILIVPAPGVLGNDSDADSDPLQAYTITSTQNGVLDLAPDGSFTYQPAPDFFGEDTFVYEATDGDESSSATVTITVAATGSARIQVIHSAPDAEVDPANVFLDGQLYLVNTAYGDASPFIEYADGTFEVALTPAGGSLGDAVATFVVTLEEGGSYILILGGTSTLGYEVLTVPNALESTSSGRFSSFFVQAGPDLPTVTISNVSDNLDAPGETPVLSNASFLDFSPYLMNTPSRYNFGIKTAGGSTLDIYRLDLSATGGKTYAILASGLLNSTAYPVTMTSYDAQGVARTGEIVTAVEPITDLLPRTFLLRGNYPNPFNPTTNIQFDLPEPAEVDIVVTDLLGRAMLRVPTQSMSAGTNLSVPIDASELSSGIYIYRVEARSAGEQYLATGTMTLIK